MSELMTPIFIMQVLTLMVSTLAPLISGFEFCLKHIKRSSCCGSSIEMETSKKNLLEP